MRAALLGPGSCPGQWDAKSTGVMLGVSLRASAGQKGELIDACKADTSRRTLPCWGLRQNKLSVLVLSSFEISILFIMNFFALILSFQILH